MIEIFRKGFRLDIPSSQIVTFKKAQNLNGVQDRYSYSNTISIDKTANIKKLLELTDLPIGKVPSMQNGFEVDIVLNGSIQLRNQILKITKETLTKVDLYLLYSESVLIQKLKALYINDVVKDIKYKKTLLDWTENNNDPLFPTVYLQTQSPAGKYVIEEMPVLINLQWLIKKMFTDIGYNTFGDFTLDSNTIKDYFIAPNQGTYQIYGGSGDGFSPTFDVNLTAYDLLMQTLAYFNCYITPDDTYKTVIINQWTNISNYKNTYVDYSKYFVNYQDYTYQSKLAKRNTLTYAESEETFNSYFSNPLSSEESASYLASKFGSGSTQLFDDSEVNDDGTIPLRANGELGETSAIRIYKISEGVSFLGIFSNGVETLTFGRRAVSVSMREVYNTFHKAYTDFILTPLIQNVIFRYDDILAADFSMTEVFFIEQLASYWIPLEINFSTKKDQLSVKAMLIKQRKVASPQLNNFNSVLLDFRQRVIFPTEYLLTMYPMPPNAYPWNEIIFKSYDGTKNSLYVNGVFVPADSLPQAFPITGITIEFEADMPGDTVPNKLTNSLYIQAVDTNGGISNDAYITLKHTGVAVLESNFIQNAPYEYSQLNIDNNEFKLNVLEYTVGGRPNLNNTITSVAVGEIADDGLEANDTFNLIVATENYNTVNIRTSPFVLVLQTANISGGLAQLSVRLIVSHPGGVTIAGEWTVLNNNTETFYVPELETSIASLPSGGKIRVYYWIYANNNAPAGIGSINFYAGFSELHAAIKTTKIY